MTVDFRLPYYLEQQQKTTAIVSFILVLTQAYFHYYPAPNILTNTELQSDCPSFPFFFTDQKFPGGSVINLSDLGLEDNSQLTCEARNGAQDGEGNELYDSASITLVVQGEQRSQGNYYLLLLSYLSEEGSDIPLYILLMLYFRVV